MPILTRATPIPKTQEEYYNFLNAHYSNLFGNHYPDACVPLGWHKIILFLCEQTQRMICGYGMPRNIVLFEQIKEKFGGLRVYVCIQVDNNPEDVVEGVPLPETVERLRLHVHDLIKVAERMADKTCVGCGVGCGEDDQPVKSSSFGTYCQDCWQLINSQRKRNFIP